MNEYQPWKFTYKTFDGQNLTANQLDFARANLITIVPDRILHKRDPFA